MPVCPHCGQEPLTPGPVCPLCQGDMREATASLDVAGLPADPPSRHALALPELRELWARKSDAELEEAAEQLDEYLPGAQEVIRAELERRSLPLPDPSSPPDHGEARVAPPPGGGVRVYRHPVLANVAIVKTALEAEGITTETRGVYSNRMTHAMTDVELWITDPSQEERARALVELAGQSPAPSPAWRCAACGESVEGQYGQCWSCGADRTDDG